MKTGRFSPRFAQVGIGVVPQPYLLIPTERPLLPLHRPIRNGQHGKSA
jgi:hypothetical protein